MIAPYVVLDSVGYGIRSKNKADAVMSDIARLARKYL